MNTQMQRLPMTDAGSNAHPRLTHSADPIDRNVGRRLHSLRLARGVAAVSLDLAVGVPAGTIERFEAGSRSVGASHLVRIAFALDVEPAFFFEPSECAVDTLEPRRPEIDAKEYCEARRLITAFSSLSNADVRSKMLALFQALADVATGECRRETAVADAAGGGFIDEMCEH